MTSLSVLTICGLSELDLHGRRGVTHVLSILDPEWPDPESFTQYDRHHRTLLRFHDVIETGPGLIPPQPHDVEAILAFGREHFGADPQEHHLLVHCHMGISRSTAAMTMLLAQAHPEQDENDILASIYEARPQAWPNLLMMEHADRLLDRHGRLVRALGRYYAQRLIERPDLRSAMEAGGRKREIDLADASTIG